MPTGAPSFSRGDSTGRLVAVTTGGTNAGSYYGYDGLGQVLRRIQRTDSINYLSEATYNKAGGMLTETYPVVPGHTNRRTINYSFDGAGRLWSLATAATTYSVGGEASVSSITYAPHGGLAGETLGNGLIHGLTYNSRWQPTQIKLGTQAAPTSVLNLSYNYGTTNNNGNVLDVTEKIGTWTRKQIYIYDSLNRLDTASETNGSTTTYWTEDNAYDRYGNRWEVISGTAAPTFTNNQRNGYGYDLAGNVTNDTVYDYTYDAENRINTVEGVANTFVYDGEGKRVKKYFPQNEQVRFVYGINGQLIMEFNTTDGTLSEEYVYGAGGLLATIDPTTGTRYTTSDHLGSPRVVTNSDGDPVSRHDYKPFGRELTAGEGGRTNAQGFGVNDGLRHQFTSKERDSETGLDYFGARYYSSTQGRFTSPDEFKGGPEELFGEVDPHDPLFYSEIAAPQSLNKYQYCLNNPLRFVDPDGHQENVADKIRRESARAVVVSAIAEVHANSPISKTINGIISTVNENNGFGRYNAPQNKLGRGIGHVISLAQAGGEILIGTGMAGTGGTLALASGGTLTVPAAAEAAAGTALIIHGAGVGANTWNNIFSSDNSSEQGGQAAQENKAPHPNKDMSVEGTQIQLENIEHAQKVHRKAGRPDRIRDTTKSKQNQRNALKKVKNLKDVEEP